MYGGGSRKRFGLIQQEPNISLEKEAKSGTRVVAFKRYFFLLFQFGVSGGQTGDREARDRTTHVGKPDTVSELDRLRMTPVFTANSNL